MNQPRTPYLACYDYGQGGVWLLLDAESPEQIHLKYPKLTMFVGPPKWMSSDQERALRSELEGKGFRWNVHLPPTGWLLSFAREHGPVALPPTVCGALGHAVELLKNEGLDPAVYEESSSFGNFFVTFAGPAKSITIARDRGQFLLSGPPGEELERFGLWRAFSAPSVFTKELRSWLVHK